MNEEGEVQLAARLGIPLARVRAVRKQAAADLEALLVGEGSARARHRFRQTVTAAVMRHVVAESEAHAQRHAQNEAQKKGPASRPDPEGSQDHRNDE